MIGSDAPEGPPKLPIPGKSAWVLGSPWNPRKKMLPLAPTLVQ